VQGGDIKIAVMVVRSKQNIDRKILKKINTLDKNPQNKRY
jgi:hypothetical protein